MNTNQAVPIASDELQRLRASHARLLAALSKSADRIERLYAGRTGYGPDAKLLDQIRAAIAHAQPCYHDDKPSERTDLHISTGPGDLDCAGRPLLRHGL